MVIHPDDLPSYSLAPTPITVFIDDGCSAMALISHSFAKELNVPHIASPTTFAVFLADGRPGQHITRCTVPLTLTIGSHQESLSFLLADIHQPIILGLPWMRLHNPTVDWTTLQFTFNHPGCLLDNHVTALGSSVSPSSPSLPPQLHHIHETFLSPASHLAETLSFPSFPSLSVASVLLDKSFLPSDIPLDDRGVPLCYHSYSATFAPKSDPIRPLPPHRPYDMAINFTPKADGSAPDLPLPGKIYPISPSEEDSLKEYITTALSRGWIRPSSSPVGSPRFFVAKPNGGRRLCVDYRNINKITTKNRYPLPIFSDIFPKLAKARVFTKLDQPDAYH
jgi:hypothetical protein